MTVDLQRAREDVQAFSEAIGTPLTDWQATAARLEQRTTVIVAPRQSGKSRTLAVLALHAAFRRSNQHVLIISAGENAARRLLGQTSRIATSSPLLRGSVVDDQVGLLKLTNGSAVWSVPASEKRVRGTSVELLLVDECRLVDDDLLLSAAIPTTSARPEARIVLASSPGAADGAFYRFARDGEIASGDLRTFTWRLPDAHWISASVIESARRSLAPSQFAREFLGEFTDVGADERVIERMWVDRAVALSAHDEQLGHDWDTDVVYGLDVARHGGDESVLVSVRSAGRRRGTDRDGLLEDRRLLVIRVEFAMFAPDLMRLAADVAAIVGHAPVWVDAAGMGWGVRDRLEQLGANPVSFVASERASDPRRDANRRAEAWWTARELFEAAAVDLDADDEKVAGQLAAVRYRLNERNARQIQSKEEMRVSPDRADAVVIGLWGARSSVGASRLRALMERASATPSHPLLQHAESVSGWRRVSWPRRGQPVGLQIIDEVDERGLPELTGRSEWLERRW